MGDYEQLKVWEKAHKLTCAVYRVTGTLPSRHQYIIGDQLRRAALSVGTNIVEDAGRNHDGHFRNSLTMALGEANEVHYLLLVVSDIGVLATSVTAPLRALADEVRRMIAGLMESVRQRGRPIIKKARA
jgi:four helix bundle protein